METIAKLKNEIEYYRRLSYTDELTSIYNRRYTNLMADKYFTPAAGLLLIDVDNFRKINNTYGHKSGDMALIVLARILEVICPKSSLISRWGGDEFLVLCPSLENEKLEVLGNDIVYAMQSIDLGGYRPLISLGGACGYKFDDVLVAADDAFYFCKKNGRNQSKIAK